MIRNPSFITLVLSFTFRNKVYDCDFFIDNSCFPCFIFVFLKDKDLIKEFGDDITIKTDGDNRLPKKDDYPELAALRQALFDVIKTTPAFIAEKSSIRLSNEEM
jgi:hypothetical protein